YMPPEQLRSMKTVDVRADIWSLGVILYQLLSGRRPFEGSSMIEALLMISEDPPAPLGSFGVTVPEGLEAVILRCLEKDRDRRPGSITELALALEPFGSGAAPLSVGRIVQRQGRSPSMPDDSVVPRKPAPSMA